MFVWMKEVKLGANRPDSLEGGDMFVFVKDTDDIKKLHSGSLRITR